MGKRGKDNLFHLRKKYIIYIMYSRNVEYVVEYRYKIYGKKQNGIITQETHSSSLCHCLVNSINSLTTSQVSLMMASHPHPYVQWSPGASRLVSTLLFPPDLPTHTQLPEVKPLSSLRFQLSNCLLVSSAILHTTESAL